MKYYQLDDAPANLLLRKDGFFVEKLTTDGWEMWVNPERFDQRSDEITKDEARAVAERVNPAEAAKIV